MIVTYLPSTASKQESRFPKNYPKQFIMGKGAYLYDKDGKEYFDMCASLGAISLGYRYPVVDEAVIKTIRDQGNIFSLSSPQERVLADILCDMIPGNQMVRFAHNGKDVCEAAIRLARFVTGREVVLSFSYHGASDVFMACTKTDAGVPECLKRTIKEFDYNDLKGLKELFKRFDVAAVIMEPHTIRFPCGFLHQVRELCNHYKSLLIFDEVVSFPRYKGYTAQRFFNCWADLTCVSKGIANGYPISALLGKEKYMRHLKDKEVFFSTTFGGNLIGVSAAIATLQEVVAKDVPFWLGEIGRTFRDGIKENPYVKTVGVNQRQFFECSDANRQKIWQEMIKKNVFFHVPIFFSYSMLEHTRIDHEIEGVTKNLNEVIENLPNIKLEGKKATEVFKKR